MHIHLQEKERKEIADFLKKLLASTYSLYLKTQNYHWNVQGSHFYALHLLFESHYNEMAEAIDEMAERVRALGYHPDGSFTIFQKLTLIQDETEVPVSHEMIKRLVADHETLIRFLREHFELVEHYRDGATSDFINKRLAIHEKSAWMLRSHLSETICEN